MKITIDTRKSLHENAAEYYEKAKKIRKKIQGLEKAIEETKKEIKKAEKEEEEKKEKEKRKSREKKWYEKFHWFYTSNNKLCIGGRDASQNDLIFKKYMEDSDLFFHADIIGGSVVILKDGINADEQEKRECAQFAASFSKAWGSRYSTIDVYSLKKEQLSKHSQGEYVGKGGIAMEGEREWFKNTPLILRVGVGEEEIEIVPECSKRILKKNKKLTPGKEGKEKIAKFLSKLFGVHTDELIAILPSGGCSIR
ncbi:MAG: NFACT RNA binding domain-containing protein [Candidatus ainarchaeum sp.]|nr:NFACT RNA binding domain-containing protein [Candidatus ainarchaeum sp.]